MTDNTTNNNEEETKRIVDAVKFVSNYYTSKHVDSSLAVSDVELSIDNLVTICNFLFTVVSKLVDIEMAKGSPITSVNRNLDELDSVLKRIYS